MEDMIKGWIEGLPFGDLKKTFDAGTRRLKEED